MEFMDTGIFTFLFVALCIYGIEINAKSAKKYFAWGLLCLLSLGMFEVYQSYSSIHGFKFDFFVHSPAVIGYFVAVIPYLLWKLYPLIKYLNKNRPKSQNKPAAKQDGVNNEVLMTLKELKEENAQLKEKVGLLAERQEANHYLEKK
jgi:hypothetical protein